MKKGEVICQFIVIKSICDEPLSVRVELLSVCHHVFLNCIDVGVIFCPIKPEPNVFLSEQHIPYADGWLFSCDNKTHRLIALFRSLRRLLSGLKLIDLVTFGGGCGQLRISRTRFRCCCQRRLRPDQ